MAFYHMRGIPAGVDLVDGFPTFLSSSLLDSSLLELPALGFAFLAVGPFEDSFLVGGAFLFLASGDLGSTKTITYDLLYLFEFQMGKYVKL